MSSPWTAPLAASRECLPPACPPAKSGFKSAYIARDNGHEASLSGLEVYPVESLQQLHRHLIGERLIERLEPTKLAAASSKPEVDLGEIYGQALGKRALEIAAAGGHNLP